MMLEHSLRRLTKDLKDLIEEQKREPIYNIAARPLEESLFVWHANLVGPGKFDIENDYKYQVL